MSLVRDLIFARVELIAIPDCSIECPTTFLSVFIKAFGLFCIRHILVEASGELHYTNDFSIPSTYIHTFAKEGLHPFSTIIFTDRDNVKRFDCLLSCLAKSLSVGGCVCMHRHFHWSIMQVWKESKTSD